MEYDTDKLRAHWQARGIGVCIPPKSNRVLQHPYNKNPLSHPAHGRELILPLEGPPPPQPAARQAGHQLPGVCLLCRSPDKSEAEDKTLSLDPNVHRRGTQFSRMVLYCG